MPESFSSVCHYSSQLVIVLIYYYHYSAEACSLPAMPDDDYPSSQMKYSLGEVDESHLVKTSMVVALE